ncbi:hypothetical protein JCM10908_002159 [Rhodotorula pacifica]|uniref:uncharacterized protein n=1 Tax=Rhodotorula pacifica TaxID=1495444 RepID=UPI00316DADDD
MLTLDTLPLPILLHIIEHFPTSNIAEDTRIVTISVGIEESLKVQGPDVFALSACNRTLRHQLLPTIFGDFMLGKSGPGRPSQAYVDKLAWLARESGELLGCIRQLLMGSLSPEAIKAATACIAKMPKLEKIQWYAHHPIPPALAEALALAPSFDTLILPHHGVDSLPSILPLAGKITRFHLETEREAPGLEETIKLCPDLPGYKRRSAKPWNERNLATLDEQREAVFRHLPPFLRQASNNLEELSLDGMGLVAGETPFPWLQRVFDGMVDENRQFPKFPRLNALWLRKCTFKSLAFKHLLQNCADSLRVLELMTSEHGALQAPSRPLPLLKEFCYFMQDNVRCVDFVNAITQNSPLVNLHLNGARPTDMRELFGPLFRCGDSLRQLRFHGAPWNNFFKLDQVKILVAACPNLIALDLKGSWELEAADLLDALEPLQELRRLAFDHPWEKPRTFPFPGPDGRTIRSERNGDFRVISVMGTSIEEEIAKRIREDIDAVRSKYKKRFKDSAEQMPKLERVCWSCTEAVTWTWTFERRLGKRGQPLIICHDEVDIPYGKSITGPQAVGGAVYLREPGM